VGDHVEGRVGLEGPHAAVREAITGPAGRCTRWSRIPNHLAAIQRPCRVLPRGDVTDVTETFTIGQMRVLYG